MLFRYQERMHITYQEVCATPWEQIERAFFIWSLDSRRDKLEADRQAHKAAARQLHGQ
jgi:hypothetical protein